MILGVVPLAIKVWKPEIAPQAMVIKQNGNSLPATTGPEPSMKRLTAGNFNAGKTRNTPSARAKMVPSFMNVLK